MEEIKDYMEPMQTHSSSHFHQNTGNKERGKVPQSASPVRRKPCEEKTLEESDSKEPWTEQEELEMLITHQKYQNKWSSIAQEIKGRSNNSIKNRFYSIFRKIRNKIKKLDFNYTTRFEILEAAYIISLMKQYFANQNPIQDLGGKRGKDFIYSLLKGLYIEEVTSYRASLEKHIGKETTLEEFWLEMANQNTKQDTPKPDNEPSNLFSYIAEPPVYEKAVCTLPLPHNICQASPLTNEEKEFIRVQAFQSKEPSSAGSCFPSLMSCVQSPEVFSANQLQGKDHFEGFSDFAAVNNCPPPKSFALNFGVDSAFHAVSTKSTENRKMEEGPK